MPEKENQVKKSNPGLFDRIYAVVDQIPVGRVATYGQIAALAGCTARQAGYAMAAVPGYLDIPWHRVINSQGKISLRADGQPSRRQRERLQEEGIAFDRYGKVDLDRVGWQPQIDEFEADQLERDKPDLGKGNITVK